MKKKLLRLLVEMLCILIAVTLSFYLDDVRERKNDVQHLKEIIASLVIDIEEASNDHDVSAQFASHAIDTIDLCLKMAQEHQRIAPGLIHEFLYYAGTDHSVVVDKSSAYAGLLASNVWQQIPDSIRRSVFILYELDYGVAKAAVDHVSEYCAFIKTNFFVDLHFDLVNPKGDSHTLFSLDGDNTYLGIEKGLRDRRFRSAVIMLRNQYSKAIRYHREASVAARTNVNMLKSYLANL